MAWKQASRQPETRLSENVDRATRARARLDRPCIDVRAARLKLGMTQPAFSECFGVALPTLRKWEQGARRPEGPARVLLRVIEAEPDAVRRALTRNDTPGSAANGEVSPTLSLTNHALVPTT
jgi:putative transcriptional regulator